MTTDLKSQINVHQRKAQRITKRISCLQAQLAQCTKNINELQRQNIILYLNKFIWQVIDYDPVRLINDPSVYSIKLVCDSGYQNSILGEIINEYTTINLLNGASVTIMESCSVIYFGLFTLDSLKQVIKTYDLKIDSSLLASKLQNAKTFVDSLEITV